MRNGRRTVPAYKNKSQSNRMDDRAYTVALVAWMLSNMQREHIVNKKKPKDDPKRFFKIRAPRKVTEYS